MALLLASLHEDEPAIDERHRVGSRGDLLSVHTDPTLIDRAAGIAPRRTHTGRDEKVDHRLVVTERLAQFGLGDDPAQGLEALPVEISSTEQRGGRQNRPPHLGSAMNEFGHLVGEHALRMPGLGRPQVLGHHIGHVGDRQQRELEQEALDITIVGSQEVLVELVGQRALGGEPHRTLGGLAELGAVGAGHERHRESVDVRMVATPDHVDPGRDVAPLVGSAHLEFTPVTGEEFDIVVRLQKHVAELGEGDALLALEPALDRFLGEHRAHGDVLADVTQEVEYIDADRPLAIVDEHSAVVDVDDRGELLADRGQIATQRIGIEQVALVGTTGRITDHSGRPSGKGDRPVAEVLKPPKQEQGDEIADVETVGRRVEPAVQGDRTLVEATAQLGLVGHVLDESPRPQVVEDGGTGACCRHSPEDRHPRQGWIANSDVPARLPWIDAHSRTEWTLMRRLLLAFLVLASFAAACSYETQDFEALFGEDFSVDQLATAQSSRIFDRNGTTITDLRGEQNRTDILFEQVPELVYNAVVAIEDERFWDHSGVDFKAILRAARSNVNSGGISQGGSTITQQYVGNVFLERSDQTAGRKVEEIFMARRFEQNFSKEFILGRYLNWVYFGNGAYGVEAAAREYFGPPDCARQQSIDEADDRDCLKVTELTIVEAATIAGLIQAPGRFNPYDNYEAARDRRDLVLLRMLANEYITEDEYKVALLQPIELVEDIPILEERYPAAHFVDEVKQWFLDNELFGENREERAQLLFEGGLTIHTTIDLDLQARAEAAVESVLPDIAADGRRNPDAAVVTLGTTSADDGHVLAMVGGRDFFGDGDFAKLNLASGTGRQAGSSMKPIALAAALQTGIPVTSNWNAPVRLTIDEPQICGGPWNVRGGTGGTVSLIRATRSSLNTVYAQVMVALRPAVFVDWAERLGIGEGRLQPVCAAVLGSENVNMVEMATVFSTFSRSGTRVDPVLVTEVVNPDGTLLYEYSPTPTPVLSQSIAHQLTWILEGVITGGTGRRAQLADGRPAAGKTGTAQLNGDATFVGYTAQRTTAVWVGFPEEVIPMSNYFNGGRVEGGTFPALIWKAVMDQAHDGLPVEEFPAPPPSSTTTTIPVVPQRVTVPDLIGRALDEGLYSEMRSRYITIEAFEVERDDVPEGQIVSQVPAAGIEAPGRTVITVGVAVAPLDSPIPNVIGMTEAVARQTLAGEEFLQEVSYETNPDPGEDGVVPGAVWAQDPPGGTDRTGVETVRIKVNPVAEPSDEEDS